MAPRVFACLAVLFSIFMRDTLFSKDLASKRRKNTFRRPAGTKLEMSTARALFLPFAFFVVAVSSQSPGDTDTLYDDNVPR